MALGDFGGGLLAGMQGAQAFAQQRRDNKYRQDVLEFDRQKQQENIRQFNESIKIDQQNADTNSRLATVSEGNLEIAQAAEKELPEMTRALKTLNGQVTTMSVPVSLGTSRRKTTLSWTKKFLLGG